MQRWDKGGALLPAHSGYSNGSYSNNKMRRPSSRGRYLRIFIIFCAFTVAFGYAIYGLKNVGSRSSDQRWASGAVHKNAARAARAFAPKIARMQHASGASKDQHGSIGLGNTITAQPNTAKADARLAVGAVGEADAATASSRKLYNTVQDRDAHIPVESTADTSSIGSTDATAPVVHTHTGSTKPTHDGAGGGIAPALIDHVSTDKLAVKAPVLSEEQKVELEAQKKQHASSHEAVPLRNGASLAGLAPVITTDDVTQHSKASELIPEQHQQAATPATAATSLFDLSATNINGQPQSLSAYQGKVVLVVNVASACGYTDSNYQGLMKMYHKYRDYGLEILAFPCNQFGAQEAGSEADIKSFCTSKYDVDFPMFSKVDVNGPNTHPVFQFLRRALPTSEGGGGGFAVGKELSWNFNKFLVDQSGHPVKLFGSEFVSADIEGAVYHLLHNKAT